MTSSASIRVRRRRFATSKSDPIHVRAEATDHGHVCSSTLRSKATAQDGSLAPWQRRKILATHASKILCHSTSPRNGALRKGPGALEFVCRENTTQKPLACRFAFVT